MWVFTTSGFVSAVRSPNDRTIIVRSRDKASLAPIANRFSTEVIKTPVADYPYRVEVTQDDFAEWVREQAELINYPNFKSEVAIHRGQAFSKTLSKVWSVMHEVEDSSAREKI